MARALRAWAINRGGKNSVRNLRYGPRTRLVRGISTAPFSVERRVRQGDPLSPYLFIIVIETLCISIRRSKDIQGITVDAEEIKLGLFADDLTDFLRNDISLHKFLEKLLENVQASGLIMIRLKSCYLAIVCAPF